MCKLIDLTGRKYGRLTVLSRSENGKHRSPIWKCQCDCGNLSEVFGFSLKHINKPTRSCGCLRREALGARATHGMTRAPEYRTWLSIRRRCHNKKDKDYHYYGSRGIKVCDRWLNSFDDFYADMGDRPEGNYSIDRIDNNGNYEPSNCRWATSSEQQRNKRTTKLNEESVKGIRHSSRKGVTYSNLAETYNVAVETISAVVSGKIWA